MSRSALRCSLGVLLAAGVLVAIPTARALAGSYSISTCSPFANGDPWSEVDTFPAGLSAGEMCGGPAVGPLGGGNAGALFAEDNTENAGSDISNGAKAGWAFSAPAGTDVTGVSYYRNLEIAPTSDDFVVGMFEADGAPLETCQGTFSNGYTCTVSNNQTPASYIGLSTSGLFFGVECQLQPSEEHCLSGSAGHHLATADMYSVTVTLSEQSSPIVSSEAGALWGGGVVSGTVPLTFQASDPSGIEAVVAREGLAVGASTQESCDFTETVPCPQLEPGQLDVETTRFPDGPAELSLIATDAAGNTTVVSSPALVIDNNGPATPASFIASAVGGGSDVVDLAWSDPVNPPEPVTGTLAQLCQAICEPAVALSPSGAGQLTAPAPGSYTARLWLMDSDSKGGPQNAATTSVTVPAATPSGKGSEADLRPLRMSGHLHKGRLTVTVDVPSGEHGPVSLHLDVPHDGRLVLAVRREVKPSHGVARTVFVLARQLRQPAKLVLVASAGGARSARLTVAPRR